MAAMRRAPLISLFVFALGACGACGASSDGGGATEDDPVTDTPSSEPSTGGSDESMPIDPNEPPVITVTGEPTEGGIAIVVQSRGAESARVRSTVRVESRDGEGWATVPTGESVQLRARCEDQPPECVELVPGAELRAVPWGAMAGEAQCDCERCAPVDAGEYRFVLESCAPEGHAPHELTSAPFDVGG